MGTTYFVANSAKQQYFDPDDAGGSECTRRNRILWGLSGHALGVLLLPDVKLEFHLELWIGDPLVLVGDYPQPDPTKQFAPFQQDATQETDDVVDAYDIVTKQFGNVTLNLIAQLCKLDSFTAMDHFLSEAERCERVFLNLVHSFTYLKKARHIEMAVVERFGAEWCQKYIDALGKTGGYYPLPMTPENNGQRQFVRAADVLNKFKTNG